MLRLSVVLAALSGATAFSAGVRSAPARASPSAVQMSEPAVTRRAAFAGFAAVCAPALPAFADVAPAYKLKKDYPVDAKQMLDNMIVATEMARGTPNMENIVKDT